MYTINTTGAIRNPWGVFAGSQLVSVHPNYAAAARALARLDHCHEYTRSAPGASVETCTCGRFRFTENAGPAIIAVSAGEVAS